jgi:hypothetical protein
MLQRNINERRVAERLGKAAIGARMRWIQAKTMVSYSLIGRFACEPPRASVNSFARVSGKS